VVIEDYAVDEPFFREWKARTPGERRSLERAGRLADALGVRPTAIPMLTVVGSKGKGTAALYASAALASAGLKVGTLSSPPLLTNRERIRIDGRAIGRATYERLATELNALLQLHGRRPGDRGYLSPTGLYSLVGVSHMLRERCDVLVLEAGMGGRADEVSLLAPTAVVVTRIFAEHVGVIGADVAAIARDKLGVVRPTTRSVLSIHQDHPEVVEAFRAWAAAGHTPIHSFDEASGTELDVDWPPALSGPNARLGCAAARRLLDAIGVPPPSTDRLRTVLATVRPLGRLSRHVDTGGRQWTVDAAIDERGLSAAIDWHEARVGPIDTLLVCLPTVKDVAGGRRTLAGRPFVPVKIPTEHLTFGDAGWASREVDFADIDGKLHGERILALGTWSFVGAVMAKLGVRYEEAFTA
jgi:dihydrofolate synthase / folylpolyglutamate synthase